jgi:hypothetical protein
MWNTYVAVQSADETAAKVRTAGGQVVMEPFDVPGAGRMGVFADPSGATFCAWQAKGGSTGVNGDSRGPLTCTFADQESHRGQRRSPWIGISGGKLGESLRYVDLGVGLQFPAAAAAPAVLVGDLHSVLLAGAPATDDRRGGDVKVDLALV